MISSVLNHSFWYLPYGIVDYFLLSESIWRALILLVLVLDSARTMHGPAEHFIYHEQLEN